MRCVLLGLCVVALGMTAMAQEPAWEDISGGETLKGWTPLGGEWTWEDGAIVGRLTKTPEQMDQQINAWLMYEREYADFELEYEYRTPKPTNGGMQFRTHWLPKTPLAEGVTPDKAVKDAYGYQANVEQRTRLGSGKLIDENGRGTLAESNMDAAKTLSQKGWNTMKIIAHGPSIEILLNGVRANKIEDEKYLKGYFLLQVRADEKAEKVTEVQYRNIRIRDYGREGEWRVLFDGKSLDGWKKWGSEKWDVEDGVIYGRSGPKKSEGYLATEEQWKDFRVRGTFKMLGDGNFGLFYHSTIKLREDGYPLIAGVQGEVEPAYPTKSAWLYESYQRGWLIEPDTNTPGGMALRSNEWNEIEISSQTEEGGQYIRTWLNGVQVMDFHDKDPRLSEGSFALQLHTGGVDGIAWKDLYVAK